MQILDAHTYTLEELEDLGVIDYEQYWALRLKNQAKTLKYEGISTTTTRYQEEAFEHILTELGIRTNAMINPTSKDIQNAINALNEQYEVKETQKPSFQSLIEEIRLTAIVGKKASIKGHSVTEDAALLKIAALAFRGLLLYGDIEVVEYTAQVMAP